MSELYMQATVEDGINILDFNGRPRLVITSDFQVFGPMGHPSQIVQGISGSFQNCMTAASKEFAHP